MSADNAIALDSDNTRVPDDTREFFVTRSLSGRRWFLPPERNDLAEQLSLCGISRTLATLLASRGIAPDTLAGFLEPRLKDLLLDPSRLKGMDCAAVRIADAIKRKEPIAVLGDYDVDGACASALLLSFLQKMGCEPLLYIPDRLTEGYGPSPLAIDRLAAAGAKVVVTVDCGAAAHEALAHACRLEIDSIVLDHHAVENDPPAFAHVNPNGPGDNSGLGMLCAAGVTFLALVAVVRELRRTGWFSANGISEPDLMAELDLVALATVADVVPLVGVNRAFVRQGIRMIELGRRPGLVALANVAKVTPPFTPYHLGFVFGPRVNAGGRVGRCDLGARLLSSVDENFASQAAGELDLHNRERQAIEKNILDHAIGIASDQKDANVLFLWGDGWHPGVVGIVASRLKDRFERPVFVAGFFNDKDDIARGSARSVSGLNIGAVVREAHTHGLLESGGGHEMAAGFSIRRDKIAEFAAYIRESTSAHTSLVAGARDLHVDGILSPAGASLEFVTEMDRAGPFGSGNPEPIFIVPDTTIAFADVVGGSHVRLRLTGAPGHGVDAIAFRAVGSELGEGLLKARGKRVHAAGRLRRDDYNGRARVQLQLVDAALVGL